MVELDLQRFTDEENVSEPESSKEEQEPIPEELDGLGEEYAREVMAEYAQNQPQEELQEQAQPAEEKPKVEETVPYARFKEKVDEANQLKAQLAEYQRQRAQAQPRQQVPQSPQFKITPEDSAKINAAIKAEAMALTGFSDDDIASLQYADTDDPRIAQWDQGKNLAQYRVFTALRQAREEQARQEQEIHNDNAAALSYYNDFVTKVSAEPDFKSVQEFAAKDYFEQLHPFEKKLIGRSYLHIEQNSASPGEVMLVKNYFERATAAYRSRNAKKKPTTNRTVQMPRVDQLSGTATTSDGQLSTSEIEKLLAGDFTQLDKKTQRQLLGRTEATVLFKFMRI
mgnify:CR=1 FL=1